MTDLFGWLIDAAGLFLRIFAILALISAGRLILLAIADRWNL